MPGEEFCDVVQVHKAHGERVARLLAEYNVRWFTETDLSVANDPQLLELLAKSGCRQLLIGLESAGPGPLQNVDSKRWKLSQWPSYREKIKRIQSYGISVNGCFILGFDHDDPDVFERTATFVEQLALAEVQITMLTPFPGTPLRRALEQQGRLRAPEDWSRYTLFDATFEPLRMTVKQLEDGFRELMRRLYSADAYAERRRSFIAQARGVS